MSLHTPLGWVKKSKTFFLKAIMLNIKLKGLKQKTSCNHTFSPYTHPLPVELGQNIIFSECGHVAYQI